MEPQVRPNYWATAPFLWSSNQNRIVGRLLVQGEIVGMENYIGLLFNFSLLADDARLGPLTQKAIALFALSFGTLLATLRS